MILDGSLPLNLTEVMLTGLAVPRTGPQMKVLGSLLRLVSKLDPMQDQMVPDRLWFKNHSWREIIWTV